MMEFPFDCYLAIASTSLQAWKSTLAIPSFGKFSISTAGKEFARKHHSYVKNKFLCPPKAPVDTSVLRHYLGYKLHREGDLPAVIWSNGREVWYKNGVVHRDGDLPAFIRKEESQWWKNGKLHRDEDQPAVVFESGRQEWFTCGKRHRDGDLPAIIKPNGDEEWYKNGKRHRDDDKPAIIHANGEIHWYKNGLRHRDYNLPALIMTHHKYFEWYINGKRQHSACSE